HGRGAQRGSRLPRRDRRRRPSALRRGAPRRCAHQQRRLRPAPRVRTERHRGRGPSPAPPRRGADAADACGAAGDAAARHGNDPQHRLRLGGDAALHLCGGEVLAGDVLPLGQQPVPLPRRHRHRGVPRLHPHRLPRPAGTAPGRGGDPGLAVARGTPRGRGIAAGRGQGQGRVRAEQTVQGDLDRGAARADGPDGEARGARTVSAPVPTSSPTSVTSASGRGYGDVTAAGRPRVGGDTGMTMSTEGPALVDEHGRQRILHGINLVEKGSRGAAEPSAFRGRWTTADIAQLREIGLDSVRLGVLWAAVEPAPGEYCEEHLRWLGAQLDQLHAAGLAVILDGHQDLFSQLFGDGAPAWATLTQQPFEETALWSDAYLSSPAVHEALDAFWADAPAADGVGIRTRYVAMWAMLAERLGTHPAVIGYDVLNEPTPGSGAPQMFGAILAQFAELTGQDLEAVAANFEDPAAKLAQLSHLEDAALHRRLGDRLAPLLAEIEQG